MGRKLLVSMMCVMMLFTWMNYACAEIPSVPVLSDMYQGTSARLREYKSKDKRTYSRTGPGKAYTSGGGYKPYKQVKITVYYIEDDWVYSRIQYQTQEDRYAYLPKNSFSRLPSNLPNVDNLPSYSGVTNESIIPSWGPGSKYVRHENYQIPAGTRFRAFFQENGYMYAEFACAEGLVRMWLPNDRITMENAILTITEESHIDGPTGKRVYSTGEVDPPKDGSWSSWTDTPIKAKEGTEVQTRTVYRTKVEIEDWTDWIDGDHEASPEVETRIIERDGAEVHQWREYGYHYHYGDWTEWSDYQHRSSSTDILESKTQYRVRKVK